MSIEVGERLSIQVQPNASGRPLRVFVTRLSPFECAARGRKEVRWGFPGRPPQPPELGYNVTGRVNQRGFSLSVRTGSIYLFSAHGRFLERAGSTEIQVRTALRWSGWVSNRGWIAALPAIAAALLFIQFPPSGGGAIAWRLVVVALLAVGPAAINEPVLRSMQSETLKQDPLRTFLERVFEATESDERPSTEVMAGNQILS